MKALLLVLLLAACSPSRTAAEPRSWSDAVQAQLDVAAAAHDCLTMQRAFDQADANRNAALMDYINETMKTAGCYQ